MKDHRFRLWGIPALALLITLLNGPYTGPDAPLRFVISWGLALYFTAAFWLGCRALWAWLLQRLPGVEQTSRRLWALAGLSVAFTALATVLLTLPLHWLLPQWFSLRPAHLIQQIQFNLLPTVVVQTLYEALYFFQQWEQNVRRAEQLAQAGVQSQLEALQSQLDPHFLFNSLNTLSALIDPENKPAQQFVEQLADVYRYVLLSRDQATVSLAEELAFVDTYLALHKVRFRDNLRVTMQVPPALLTQHVAPLSVQLLVENALKHNVASQAQPLELNLCAGFAENYLLVENTIRPRTAGLTPGTGTGLRNIRHRYALLQTPYPVEVTAANGWFRVLLPLLPPQ